METRHKRVITTLLIAFLILVGAAIYQVFQLPNRLEFSTTGQPSVGNGNTHLVLFEDFACHNCHVFTRDVIPKIASEYIDTGKVKFTLIPVSFEENSIDLANAAIAVNRLAPNRFIAFILGLLDVRGTGKAAILQIAERVGGIDLEKLAYAIDQRLFFGDIERNLVWAKSLIGSEFGTPMLFVNGYETSTGSFESLQRRIQQLERIR